MPKPPDGPTQDCAPQPTSVKLATTGIVNGGWLKPLSHPEPLQPSFSMPSWSVASEPAPVRGVSCSRVVADQVLEATLEAFGHVEHVVARLVRHEVIAVERAAEEFVRVVEAAQCLEVRDARPRADRREGERVELGVGLRGEARELDADVLERAGIVGRDGAAGVLTL